MIDPKFYLSNPIYNMWDNYMGQVFDLGMWFAIQYYYFPHYVIGKQDEWKDWVGSSLNGWRPSNYSICRV